MNRFFLFLASGILLSVFSAGNILAQPAAKAIVDDACSKCHNTKRIYSANKNAAEWEKTLDRMIKKGAKIKAEDRDAVLQYLNTLNK